MKPIYAVVSMASLAGAGFAVAVMLSGPRADGSLSGTVASVAAPPLVSAPSNAQVLPAAAQLATGNQAPPAGENVHSASSEALSGAESGAIAALPEGLSPFNGAIGGTFDLIDHFGNARQLEDYRGKHVMVFFGYANCLAICSAALPLMGQTLDLIPQAERENIVPLMITVDPENDTPEFMRDKLAEYHPALIGMTGSDGALADVRAKFQVRSEYVAEDINGNPIYNHGSFIYLMGPDGNFQTLIPPILDPPQMAKIVTKYLSKAQG